MPDQTNNMEDRLREINGLMRASLCARETLLVPDKLFDGQDNGAETALELAERMLRDLIRETFGGKAPGPAGS